MSDDEADTEERIAVGEVSAGEAAGASVALPVKDVLTGRAFLTGKSGSGKSNSISVVIEKLLDGGYSVLVVDVDGEYYGLKEEYEILHAGADEECDIRVSPEHAERLAHLALEENVPIILDVSSWLDEREARDLLTAVARHLFAKGKKVKKPFLLVVEEIHEFIPEGGGLDECGRMLVKVAKRGRKHGLGVAGISQRPADVKKDFITQCDWLVWHRLTWGNDTDVVGRVMGSEYADRVEGLADGEAFLMTDWAESVRRVQFERKRTFDAGATPTLGEFERPELKSVSDDLVDELADITEAERSRESRIEELEAELDRREERIEELEAELAEARDLSEMAEQFSRAMMAHATGRELADERTYQSELEEVLRRGSGSATGSMADGPDDPTGDPDDSTGDPDEHREGPGATGSSRPADTPGNGDGKASWPGELSGPRSGRDRPVAAELRAIVADLDPVTRGMLAYYREHGPATPLDAHVAAGGDGERTRAYARNGRLREAGLVAHAGRGTYRCALTDRVRAEHDDRIDEEQTRAVVAAVEELFADALVEPDAEAAWPGA